MDAACPRCARTVALHEGRPFITARGVELWHISCWDARDRAEPAPPLAAPARRSRVPRVPRVLAIAAVASAISPIALSHWAHGGPPPRRASLADVELRIDEPLAMRAALAAHDDTPVAPSLEARYPVPFVGDAPLDELYPSLRDWAHPVTDSPELMPEQASRWFGASRVGIDRPECGAGHCGVDLDGPRGRPVVAVADGVVVRVERHELGLDGKSGRYVRIQHDDGTLTAYMHLDDVAEGLEVGDTVQAGQYLGTLGATAVYSAPPHLHFSLEVPNDPSARGDITDTHYVDPAPFLVRSTILPAPDRRPGTKPAM